MFSKRLTELEARVKQLERDTRLKYSQVEDGGVLTLKQLVFELIDTLGMRTRYKEAKPGQLVVEKKPAGL